ncbi:hypothetical protein PFISCL1PPCAC_18586, partial [Pristionchus fissidentatus]
MPAAKNPIANMTWDCEIEKSAQAVAGTCVFAHSKNRNNLGENLYTNWGSVTGSGEKSSNYWENEFQEHGWPGVKLTREIFDSGIGHATQMAWADSTKIGCGMTLCDDDKVILIACQYRNAGNYIGRNVYEP